MGMRGGIEPAGLLAKVAAHAGPRRADDFSLLHGDGDAFLDAHLPTEAEALPRPRSSSDVPPWARQWQRTLFDAGWLLPGNPPEFGGRDATLPQQLAYLEELAERRIYHSFNPQGLGIIAASILTFGTPEQQQRWAIPILRAEITAAAERSGVALMLALPRLYEGYTTAIRKVLADGELGRLSLVRIRLAHGGSVGEGWPPAHFYDPRFVDPRPPKASRPEGFPGIILANGISEELSRRLMPQGTNPNLRRRG